MSSKQSDAESCAIEGDEQIKTVDLMSNADAVMSHWQVSQAFMRMARRSKTKEIKAAFMQAEQRIIQNLFSTITQTQLSEQKRRAEFADSPELRQSPPELSRLAQSFPRTLLSIFMLKKNWDARLLCDRCKKYVKLSELQVFDLCSKHHESVSLHCIPSLEDLKEKLDPTSLIDLYRKYSLLRSEDDRGGDGRSEFLFARSMYNEPVHNMATLQELLQCKDLTYEERLENSDLTKSIEAQS
ncbi:MAG: hypothetical protein ACRECH_06615 [Nitrososphaerales archaeon]